MSTFTPSQRRLRRWVRFGSKVTVPLYRLLRGRGASRMAPKDAPPIFLLTTTGRKTGKPRTVVLSYLTDGDDMITVGTYGGLPAEPAWVLNLRETPEASVQIGGERVPVRAEFVGAEEADEMWRRIVDDYPIYRKPLEAANRRIPIIRLHRIESH